MISKLIEELATDKISLSQALTRTKLIQSKLNIDELKVWLTNELMGYRDTDQVPDYRKFSMRIVGDFVGPFGAQSKNTPLMLDELGKSLEMDLYEHVEIGGIKNIETHVEQATAESVIAISFAAGLVQTLSNLYRNQNSTYHLVSVTGIITPSQLRNVLEQTKQRLLDMLLDLSAKFPEFDEKFNATQENQDKARNIIHYNIYGGTNNSNLAVGETANQSNKKQVAKTVIKEFEDALKQTGIPESEVLTIKEIITSGENKETRLGKAMTWIGQLSKKMIEKGIEIQLPKLITVIHDWIDKF